MYAFNIINQTGIPWCGDNVLGPSLVFCKLSSNFDWEIDLKEAFRYKLICSGHTSACDAVTELTFATKTNIVHLFCVEF